MPFRGSGGRKALSPLSFRELEVKTVWFSGRLGVVFSHLGIGRPPGFATRRRQRRGTNMKTIQVAVLLSLSVGSMAVGQQPPCVEAFRSWGLGVGGAIPPQGSCISLAAGREFLVVLNADGSLTSFGGIGVAPTGRFIAVSGGFGHAAAITEDRRVVAWGLNHQGQTNVPSGLPAAAHVAVTYNNTAIIDLGGTLHVWGWGAEGLTAPPSGLFAEVDGGEIHFAARRTNGLVACWGFNNRGQTDVPTTLGPCLSVAAGGGIVGSFATGHTIAVTVAGQIRCWGENDQGQCSVPAISQAALNVAAGGPHSLALLADGTVVAWGANGAGQAAVPSGLTDIGLIVAGEQSSFAAEACGVPACDDADFFRDLNVNGADLGILLTQWGPNTAFTVADLTKDGMVNGDDLGILLCFWGPCPN